MASSPPLRFVLVRGLAREAGHWHDFDLHLRARFGGATVERHDLPGAGTERARPSPVSTGQIAADLRARVWAADDRPPIVVAISLGGMVGLDWRRRWPGDPLAGLVVLNTSVGGVCRPWQRMRPPAMLATLATLALGDPLARELAVLDLTTTEHRDDLDLARRHAALLDARPMTRATVLRQVAAAARFRGPLEGAGAPVLVLASAGDRMVDPICSGRIAAALGAPLAVHPDAGHDLSVDAPAWCVAEIAAWRAAVR